MESPAQLVNSIRGQSTDIFRQDFLPDAPLQVFGERLSLDKGDQTRLFVVLNTGTHAADATSCCGCFLSFKCSQCHQHLHSFTYSVCVLDIVHSVPQVGVGFSKLSLQ